MKLWAVPWVIYPFLPAYYDGLMEALTQLIHELSKLPSIGHKTATRLAYHLLDSDLSDIERLSEALLKAKTATLLCQTCFTFTEKEKCPICANDGRDNLIICVVERPCDLDAVEATGNFNGQFHVLHGLLSPVEGVGPEQIKLKELVRRVGTRDDSSQIEIIIALNPSVEGEATALYISRLVKPFAQKISKIAYGLPMGGALEFADRGTIAKAIANRVEC